MFGNENPQYKHGFTKTKIHRCWQSMRHRCNQPNSTRYKYYGGKGIRICSRWNDFLNFYADMNPTYKDGLTIDRIDNNKDYSPENCRWATRKEQSRNRTTSHYITYKSETKTIGEWSEITGLPMQCLLARINKLKWSVDKSIETKKRINEKRT